MEGYGAHHQLSMEMQIPAIVSIIGCSLIVCIYATSPSLRRKRHIELVFYVALNDLIASVGVSFGYVKSGWECSFQSFTTTYNYLASMFWSVIIAYQLYVVVCHGTFTENLFYTHLFCWLVPLFLTLIPLSTSSYGLEDDNWAWCYLKSKPGFSDDLVVVWSFLGFYLWVWLCTLATAVLFFLAICRLRSSNSLSLLYSKNLYHLGLYPLVFIICWGVPSFILFYKYVFNKPSKSSDVVVVLDFALPSSQGFFLSVIFVFNNRVVWHGMAVSLGLRKSIARRRKTPTLMSGHNDSVVEISRISSVSNPDSITDRYTDMLAVASLQQLQVDLLNATAIDEEDEVE